MVCTVLTEHRASCLLQAGRNGAVNDLVTDGNEDPSEHLGVDGNVESDAATLERAERICEATLLLSIQWLGDSDLSNDSLALTSRRISKIIDHGIDSASM